MICSESVLVRDSKRSRPNVLCFSHSEWESFLIGVRYGEFDGTTLGTPRGSGQTLAVGNYRATSASAP
jgi:hypothetical protein